MLALTQLLTYQQYKLSKDKHKSELVEEAAAVKDRFKNILFNDIAAANTLAIIYKQYGVPAKFDSVANQILSNNRYAQVLQITENGIVKNVYPDTHYKETIGTNVNTDPIRTAEEARAVERKDIYFAGPRRLRFGDTGILGKVPIVVNNNVIAVATVLTRLNIIKKELERAGIDKKKFAYQLVKFEKGRYVPFSISDTKPARESEHIYTKIPEGDWLLRVSYTEGYAVDKFPFLLSGMGVLLSLVAGLLAYRKAREPYKLNAIIDVKTAQANKANMELQERIKELTTIYKVNQILQQEYVKTDTLLQEIVEVLPPGWQYPEVCEARILFDEKEYKTQGFRDSIYKQIADFGLLDGRKGSVEVVYTENRPPEAEGVFLEEERSLINTIAEAIEVYFGEDIQQSELAKSENRFRGAFEDSAIGMGITSIEESSMGRWIKVNRSLCEMLGYTEDELLSLTFMQVTHPDDLARDLEAQAETLKGGTGTYRIEKRYMHKDGSIVWINLNVSLIKDKDKHPLYLVAQIENITEKIESQFKFQNLVENFIVGVYILQNGLMVYVNPRIAEEMGYTQEEIINQPFEKFIYREDIELVRENMKERIEKDIRSTSRYEARGIKKDGQPIWFEILGGATLYRGQPALLGTMVNITERKAIYDELEQLNQDLLQQATELAVSNADLEQSQKMYSNLFNFSPLPAWVADVNTLRFLDVNNAAVLHFGYSRDEFLSMTLKDIRLPEDIPALERAVNERIKQKDGVFRTISTHKKKNGELIKMDIQVAPISYSGISANIAIATDITERQNYINAIEAQNTRLLEISWIQSHIVRAPLSRIMGLIPLLEDSAEVGEEGKVILDHLLTSAHELDETIKNITDKSKTEDLKSLKSDIKEH
ncbi:PAS domain S-box protein [Mucilaginibacter sp. UYCu711]|uniref:PAS domain S-box protein n=1 Tax=Mucilaginibacter sp. UYCu711 TaxID=3156339 RepID=UPI003D24A563